MSSASRLKGKVAEKYGNLSDFQRDMAARGVKGSTYPTVHAYVHDESKPSVDFLITAAELLGVRPAWLILGDGEPTEIEAVATRGQGQAQERPDFETGTIMGRVDALIRELFPLYDSLPVHVRSTIWHTIAVVATVLPPHDPNENPDEPEAPAVVRAGRVVGLCMAFPPRLLPDLALNKEQLGHYALAVCQSLMFAATPWTLSAPTQVQFGGESATPKE
jgi:transcriptional regulator with XRE-family HTH domain